MKPFPWTPVEEWPTIEEAFRIIDLATKHGVQIEISQAPADRTPFYGYLWMERPAEDDGTPGERGSVSVMAETQERIIRHLAAIIKAVRGSEAFT
jgi:hypothetical protein